MSKRHSFSRKNNRVTAHLVWSDESLGHDEANQLRKLMAPIHAQLSAMFQANKSRLPRRSVLFTGGANGAWDFCPLDLADEVERLVTGAIGT